jgi:DNA invertase Pin-like site-specific DNA recombinase
MAEDSSRRGHRINPQLAFTDEAVSGRRLRRQGLNQMREAARQGRLKVLYIYSLSRLGRESLMLLMILKELVSVHGVWVISVSEGIDSRNPAWDVIATILAVVHEQFSKGLSAQVVRGLEHNIANDFSIGDWCYGYTSEVIPGQENDVRAKNGKPRKRLVIKEAEAEIVRQIFHWFVEERRSVRWIARELTRKGITKDHRSTTGPWHHDTVRGILANPKYIGRWPWGARKNKRHPMTGELSQQRRDPSEYEKWTKNRQHLRIVANDLFHRSQELLAQTAEKYGKVRGADGRLLGPTNNHDQPRHLLQGLIKCGQCGSTFKTCGGPGNRMQCSGYLKGACPVRTSLARTVVSDLILEVVRNRLIASESWLARLLGDVSDAWQVFQKAHPSQLTELQKQLTDVRKKKKRLLDQMEGDETPDPDLRKRLAERRQEEERLLRLVTQAERHQQEFKGEPTREWVLAKLRHLDELLEMDPAPAGVALQKLIGPIVVTETQVSDSKRKRLVGTISLSNLKISNEVLELPVPPSATYTEDITVLFAAPPPWAAVADKIKDNFDNGMTTAANARQIGCIESWIAKGLRWWHHQRNLSVPTFLEKRMKSKKPSRAEAIADEVKRLIDEKIPLHEIAALLKCHKDTVTAAKKIWFDRQGLPVPDGRLLRRERNPRRRAG